MVDNGYFVLSSIINNKIMMILFYIYCFFSIFDLFFLKFEDRVKVLFESDVIVGLLLVVMES